MQIKARAQYVRISPRKMRLVLDLVRGLPVDKAETQLRFVHKRAAPIVLKLLRSAIANAEDQGSNRQTLVIREIKADVGPTLKRYRPRAFGRATPIRRRSAHVTLVLEGEKGMRKEKKAPQTPSAHKHTKPLPHPESQGKSSEHEKAHSPEAEVAGRIVKRAEPKAMVKESKKAKGFLRRIFSRKTG